MAFTERSRANREAVLAAGRRVLAERGYERATVRTVAAEAGIDPSMVIRYFGGKEGLFDAAVDVDLRLPDLRAVPPAERGDRLARHFVELWEQPPTAEVLRLLLRSATTHEAAAARVRTVFAEQVVELVAALGLAPAGSSAEAAARDAARRAGRIATAVLGTALTRYVLALPPAVAETPEEVVAGLAPLVGAALA